MGMMSLEEGTKILAEVMFLDEQIKGSIAKLEVAADQMKSNTIEIKRRTGLEERNADLENQVKQLKKTITNLREEQLKRQTTLEAGGWQIPIPKNDGVKAAIKM